MIVYCVILSLVCSLRACHMWLTRNHMFIREIWGKFTSFIFWNFEIKILISKFQKSELGKFIPNFPLKHVITSTNQKGFLPSPIYKHLKGIFQTWPFSANRQNSTVFSVTSDYHEFVWYIFPCQNYVFIPLFYSSALKVPNKVNFKVLAPT